MSALPSAFDAASGTIIRRAPAPGYGNWAGGHKVSFDPISGLYALFYRERVPLERGRGAVCHVALSEDGISFTDVWTATKDELAASSIEVGHCVRHEGHEWRLYISYEIAGTSTWRIDVIRAEDPSTFDVSTRRTVLAPGDFGISWIKDPVVYHDDGYRLYAAVPARARPTTIGSRVEAAPLDSTVLAKSDDGLYFPALEYVFEPPGGDTWHGRRARINSIIRWGDGWLATYDGGRTFYDNYEEWCGLATSTDRSHWERVETGAPWVTTAEGAPVRYVYLLDTPHQLLAYYEFTLPDGSHDLRVTQVT